jgi:hypothetical protein
LYPFPSIIGPPCNLIPEVLLPLDVILKKFEEAEIEPLSTPALLYMFTTELLDLPFNAPTWRVSVVNDDNNSGVLNGSISASSNYFNITASGNSNLGVRLQGGPVICGNGYKARQGQSGTNIGNTMNTWWAGGGLIQAWVDAVNVGNFTLCDYRIKENIQPASNVLDRLCNINMFNYEMKDIDIFKKNGTQIGFFAHELKDAFPELNNLVEGEKDALTSEGGIQPQTVNAELVHLLMKSIQELNAKIIELSNRIIELENKL